MIPSQVSRDGFLRSDGDSFMIAPFCINDKKDKIQCPNIYYKTNRLKNQSEKDIRYCVNVC